MDEPARGGQSITLRHQYQYTADLLELEACRPESIVRLPREATQITTPLIAPAWEQALAAHPDPEFRQYILQGIRQGFHIGYNRHAGPATSAKANMLSAMRNPGPVDEYLAEEVAKGILELGPGTLLAKVDIRHAYRNVYPEDRHLLGMQWRGRVFVDKMLPFGLRSALKVFTALADALEWVLQTMGVEWCIHYVDDFLTAGPPNSDVCHVHLALIKAICAHIGFPLKWEKGEGPATTMVFLGIVLDTVRMELMLPEEKVGQLKALLEEWARKKACRKRELLSLIGKLAHACKIVRVGRLFLRRMNILLQAIGPLDPLDNRV